jgi:hypothetical protein
MLRVDPELATVAATGSEEEEGLAALKAEGQHIGAAHEAALGRGVNAGKTS